MKQEEDVYGPVTATARLSPNPQKGNYQRCCKRLFEELNDSKQLSDKKRFELRPLMNKLQFLLPLLIFFQMKLTEINILNASLKSNARICFKN